ncbi:MAG: hypothetical protein KatS3mg022_3422 [Armatimonadota bacterium]|nr:MAG: hypothetical protein KatS3mg022_1440 [Armatimonadota bacterium]GIV16013.1 MAG: hypothetical protein KatS3mg022_1448 [Armatimonadota bacterium]GIV17987.1 MAG: hypothetical protein KatS3mg022_3422 [Armatimonadota bacterium]
MTLKKGRDWREKFLAALARGCSVSQAARLAGVSRQHAYRCRQRSNTFAQQWEDAWEQGTDALEDEAVRRALAGSDTLLMFLLKARRPEKYRDNVRVEHDASREMLDALEEAIKRVQS